MESMGLHGPALTNLERAINLAKALDPAGCGPLLAAFIGAHKRGYTGREAVTVASQLYYGSPYLVDGPPENLRTLKRFRKETAKIEELLRI